MDTKNIIFAKTHCCKAKAKDVKRVVALQWTFTPAEYEHAYQLETLTHIKANAYGPLNHLSKVMLQQLNKKIYGYKHQDVLKHLLDAEQFINIQTVIDKLIECNATCYYCHCEVHILYDISREIRQWTVDRINNDLGHNKDNFYIACLDCNLRRRCRNDDKFLFTKQMKIVKMTEDDHSFV